MPVPVIGITTRNTEHSTVKIPYVSSPRSYTEAILKAGAIPVLLPLNMPPKLLDELLSNLDGVIFTGGGDIDINRFNGVDHEKVFDVDEERDEFELTFVHDVEKTGKPMLGICRGFQIINVAHGGNLFTHISDQLPNALEHSCFPEHHWDYRAHEVQVDEGTLLAEIVGEPVFQVNSLHHQGIDQLGDGLRAIANAPDGLVEALELPDYPFGLAVQWHPEWMPGDPAANSIFNAFVKAARGE